MAGRGSEGGRDELRGGREGGREGEEGGREGGLREEGVWGEGEERGCKVSLVPVWRT